ncbi:MAG: hypothetical protein FWC32_09970 [Firmicutes bacterium]|nr:hypothetical protein [Bacillota bacterium]
MITIKQLAAELGLSKQAIYNRIIKDPLKSMLVDLGCEPQVSVGGTIYLSEKCAEIVRSVYAEKYSKPDSSPVQGGYGRKRATKTTSNNEMRLLLTKFDKIQTMMSGLAQAEDLQNALNEKGVEVAKLSGMVNILENVVSQKDAQLNILHDKYVEAVAHIKLYQAQIMTLKKAINS